MSQYLTARFPRSNLTATAPQLAGTFLNQANNNPTRAIQLAHIHVVGKTAQRAVIAAIGSVLLRMSAARTNTEGANG
jgi:hypothetical protein